MKQEWQDIISERLGVEPIRINSGLVSAQNRIRIYWTNIPGVKQPFDTGILLGDILESHVDEKYYLSDRARAGFERRQSNNKERGAGFGHNLKTAKDKSNTITLRYYKDGKECLIDCGKRWRKLTPVEVERLQGLPDNYTAGISDMHRYMALGNGWNVPTIKHILKHI